MNNSKYLVTTTGTTQEYVADNTPLGNLFSWMAEYGPTKNNLRLAEVGGRIRPTYSYLVTLAVI